MEYDLLDKTELWVDNVRMDRVNLTEVARAVAETLHLDPREVLVVDVRDTHLTLDILRRIVRAEDIVGKRDQLLERLAAVPGLIVSAETDVHSDGVLGMIAVPPEDAAGILRSSERLGAEIRRAVAKRAIVFSSGFELQRGMIEDTNSPLLQAHLQRLGYQVTLGPVLEDDEDGIAVALEDAASRGFGLIVTTGGVGAEDKDRTVEALLRLDPEAVAPYLVKYAVGTGRHQKDGVRIGVGQLGISTLVCLPGPTDEVQAALRAMEPHLATGSLDKEVLADAIARELRGILTAKMRRHHHPAPPLPSTGDPTIGEPPMTLDYKAIALELLAAEEACKPVEPLTARFPGISVLDAYRIQLEEVAVKQGKGARIVGKKIGLTSKAMQTMLNVPEPDYGHLFDRMVVPPGEPIPASHLLQPKAEGEIAFILSRDLTGPGLTVVDVLAATEAVIPAIEIVDSRVKDWKIKIQDTVADNASSARLILGSGFTSPRACDLRLVGMVLEKNGEVVSTGAGAAVLGHPAQAVAWLANKLSEFGLSLKAGEIILSGAVTAAPPAGPGDVFAVHFDRLGSASVRFSS